MTLRERLDRWIFDGYGATAGGLALYRMAFVLFVVLFVAPGHSSTEDFAALFGFPAAFYAPPPGPMQVFSGFPPAWVGGVVQGLLSLSLAALFVGYRTRLAAVLTGALFLFGYGFSYAFGKINHNILFVLVPLVMAPSGWGAALSVDARRGVRRPVARWTLSMLALLVGFGFFTAGFAKLIGGWLDPTTHATQGHLVKQFFVRGRQDLLAPQALGLSNGFVWEVLDYLTVFFELGFLVAVFVPRLFRLFAAAAVLFHCSTVLMLNIAFTFNLIVYAAFLPWDAAYRGLRPWWQRATAGASAAWWVPAAGLVALMVLGSPLLWLDPLLPFTSDLSGRDLVAHGLALAVVGAVALRAVRNG